MLYDCQILYIFIGPALLTFNMKLNLKVILAPSSSPACGISIFCYSLIHKKMIVIVSTHLSIVFR